MNRENLPSTAAITTLNSAVSVAVVELQKAHQCMYIKTRSLPTVYKSLDPLSGQLSVLAGRIFA